MPKKFANAMSAAIEASRNLPPVRRTPEKVRSDLAVVPEVLGRLALIEGGKSTPNPRSIGEMAVLHSQNLPEEQVVSS